MLLTSAPSDLDAINQARIIALVLDREIAGDPAYPDRARIAARRRIRTSLKALREASR